MTLAPLAHGGGQERGLRPGTPNVAGIAGFGEACRLAAVRLDEDSVRLRGLSARFLSGLTYRLDGVHLNGDAGPAPARQPESHLRRCAGREAAGGRAATGGVRRRGLFGRQRDAVAGTRGSGCAAGTRRGQPAVVFRARQHFRRSRFCGTVIVEADDQRLRVTRAQGPPRPAPALSRLRSRRPV